ncbi:delta-lactam-biosynthetic de-N-acetylase [Clostridium sp. SHJSY1]|uniref:delta-lactam-biosynthetic de-N-acetylase n=1 Tax=Clostridium sp. SHJSY1 TaxID=2942483 RepID=UPI002876F379|nr:delta-lactam-biosynthetic de-N-acetylase [Clostridium sp. SHJSY1]MDS0527293.1 delta-lactam-biosynthetic de-N-acetylase [Clostridium sp. SHJSY1]
MKKNIVVFILATSLLFLLLFPITKNTNASNYGTELNWNFVPSKVPGEIPQPAKESIDFLKDCNGYYLGDTSQKVLYLTFDEGYEKGYTSNILDTLKELEVPAAFFVTKPYIDKQSDLITRMVNEGHLVCNHSHHHYSMASIHDKDAFNKEITDVEDTFKTLTKQNMPKFFRPPMGKYTKESLEMTKELGYKTIFWSFAYRDWFINDQPSEEYAIKKIKSGVHPGSILLLHAVSKTNTNILKTVLTDLKSEGYEFRPLTDLPE